MRWRRTQRGFLGRPFVARAQTCRSGRGSVATVFVSAGTCRVVVGVVEIVLPAGRIGAAVLLRRGALLQERRNNVGHRSGRHDWPKSRHFPQSGRVSGRHVHDVRIAAQSVRRRGHETGRRQTRLLRVGHDSDVLLVLVSINGCAQQDHGRFRSAA